MHEFLKNIDVPRISEHQKSPKTRSH